MTQRTLHQAAADLYGAEPQDFVSRRTELAAAATAGGDAELAAGIKALRKPTASAALLNRLARTERDLIADVVALGAQLRHAQSTFDGPALRELTAQRRTLTDLLLREVGSVSTGVRDEIVGTVAAALADPAVGRQLQAGVLVRATTWDGFGDVESLSDLEIEDADLAGDDSFAPAEDGEQRLQRPDRSAKQAAARLQQATRRRDDAQAALTAALDERTEADSTKAALTAQLQALIGQLADVQRRLDLATKDAADAADAVQRATKAVADADGELAELA